PRLRLVLPAGERADRPAIDGPAGRGRRLRPAATVGARTGRPRPAAERRAARPAAPGVPAEATHHALGLDPPTVRLFAGASALARPAAVPVLGIDRQWCSVRLERPRANRTRRTGAPAAGPRGAGVRAGGTTGTIADRGVQSARAVRVGEICPGAGAGAG